ncbi:MULTISPECIES: acyl-homoserine-lactone synthase [unclassified Pseudomonas]|uniref:acyl-homoserine-lactone synthase n=1 Tax=unclassified Pseudomonas TaxID=196821 RepID=UPI000A1F44AD|nr:MULTISPECIES: acyl-homoserine-lactone synthase [unclassified Pseudomonas]
MDYLSGRYDQLTPAGRQRLAHYRYQVFVERLGWDLSTPADFEFDQFDHSGTHYIVAEEEDGNIKGCARLLPTTQPYLLSEVFTSLLDDVPAPSRDDIWELSRFTSLDLDTQTGRDEQMMSDENTVGLFMATLDYARTCGVSQLVSVSPLAVGRLLRRGGIDFKWLAPPRAVDNRILGACCITVQ